MAFEAFRAAGRHQGSRSRWRSVIYAGSVLVHVVLISAGVAYSFWHVEELSPPRLKLTFMSTAPPPPPPPPPPGGSGAPKKKPVPKIRPVEPKLAAIVQPRETPKQEAPPKEDPTPGDGEKGGVKGGTIGGTVGGTIGGTIGGKPGGTIGGSVGAPAKLMAPHLGAAQKLSGAEPPFPVSLRKTGIVYRVLVKICVTTSGAVDRVTLSKGADPLLDDGVLATVKTWRYRPLAADNVPVPFCYPAVFEFKPQ
jgi:periplasmic protein TonB